MTETIAAVAADLGGELASFVTENRLPGAAAGVVHRNGLAWSATTGFAASGRRSPVEQGTLFRIASITMTFTGTAVMQLRDAGLLDLDEPAVKWLPELRGAVSNLLPIEAVTIRRMLCHESGLPAEHPGTDWSVPDYQGVPGRTLSQAGDKKDGARPASPLSDDDFAARDAGPRATIFEARCIVDVVRVGQALD